MDFAACGRRHVVLPTMQPHAFKMIKLASVQQCIAFVCVFAIAGVPSTAVGAHCVRRPPPCLPARAPSGHGPRCRRFGVVVSRDMIRYCKGFSNASTTTQGVRGYHRESRSFRVTAPYRGARVDVNLKPPQQSGYNPLPTINTLVVFCR